MKKFTSALYVWFNCVVMLVIFVILFGLIAHVH